jgi:tRNA pseudouridine38-40 synthase
VSYRYFIFLQFDGSKYSGWQIQPNAISIQQVIEEKLSILLREKINITGAGRTDSGVHARYMVAHFNSILDNLHLDTNLFNKINKILPSDIALFKIEKVNVDAHARFDALWRTYHYTINKKKDPFFLNYSMYTPHNIDIKLLNNCCEILKKYDDFQSFCKYHHGANTYICKIMEAFWTENEQYLIFTVTADRFLRNMVRAIVGSMLDVGRGKHNITDFEGIILKKDRIYAGQSADAKGLSLDWIEYPEKIYTY